MNKSNKRLEPVRLLQKQTDNALFEKSVLPNGLTIITEEIPGVESIALGITVNAGSRDDYNGKEGLSHFMEHIAFRHTKTRSSRQLAEGFESVGAYVNAFTTQEHTCFYVRTLSRHFNKTIRLLSDITLNPIFREKDIEKERDVIIEEIHSAFDDPEEYIFDIGDGVLFDNHPLGNPIQGYEESVNSISSQDLIRFHSEYYHPSNFTVTAVGNINHGKVVDTVSKLFRNIPVKNNIPNRYLPAESKNVNYEEELPVTQAHILLGKKIASFSSKEKYPILLLNTLLGDGMSSRLYQRLREKNGIAYTIYSTVNFYSDCGILYIYAATEKSKLKLSENLIFKELTKLTEKITLTNLKKAKEQLKSALIMEMENLTTRMISLIKDELLIGNREPMDEVIDTINAVTLEEIQIIAGAYLRRENWHRIIIKPRIII